MKIIGICSEFVEVLWVDDSEIEYIPIPEFIKRYGIEKFNQINKKQ
jgi:hypothetical protein